MKNTYKISTIINKTFVWVLILILSINTSIAQDPTDLPDAPVDTAAPIDDYVWVLVLVAVTFAILKFRAIYKQGLNAE